MYHKMKKSLVVLSALAVLGLLAVNCDKGDEKNFSGVLPVVEYFMSDGSWTEKRAVALGWETNDTVCICGSRYVAVPDSPDSPTARLIEAAGETPAASADGYWEAYCPASLVQGQAGAVLPSVQKYGTLAATTASMPFYAVGKSKKLYFGRLCGLFTLNLVGADKVDSIEVTSQTKSLCGKFHVGDGNLAVIDDGIGKVVLDCGDGVQTSITGTDFHIVLPMGTYDDLVFRVVTTDGMESVLDGFGTITVSKDEAPVRSRVLVVDSDGDGVPDSLDQCPDTPAEAIWTVDENGCPRDSDGDGVADYLDQCPGTPAEAIGKVDVRGCPTDIDGDGVYDYEDLCPETPGIRANKGCPEVK